MSPETQRRVEAAARRLAYRPNKSARVLRGARQRLLGVLVPDIAHPLYGQWLRGAGEAARQHGYILLICDGQNSMRVIEAQLDRLLRECVDGVLLAGSTPAPRQLRRLLEAGVPIGPDITPLLHPGRRSRHLRADAERPALLAAFTHLIDLGHRRIAYLAQVERDERYLSTLQRLRIACLRERLTSVGASWDPSPVVEVADLRECEARLASLFALRPRHTALVVGAEVLAPAALRQIRSAGLAIPRDLSVVVCGDSGWEEACQPALSVVRHDYAGIAHAETERLIARIERGESASSPTHFAAEYVARASCAPPGGGGD